MDKKVKIIVALFIIVFLFVYLYAENNFLVVSNYEIESSKISKEFDNFKIIQISDYHNTHSTSIHNDIKKTISKEKPDIIVITGDLIDSSMTDIAEAIDLIRNIKEYAPIYYVSGNHEAVVKEYDELKDKMTELGVKVLSNESIKIEKNNSYINLIGVRDPRFYSTSADEAMNNILNEIIIDTDDYNILLSHRPELFSVYKEFDIDLSITGHTHGGQIRLPFIGGLIAPDQGLFPKYDSGLYEKSSSKMIVSKGIGNSVIPFRINNRPELVVITLKSIEE
jgi:predicted MPP superfamily phosphohydrolase